MAMQDNTKVKERVQKLLNQAKDREGTPEGDSFYAKAFDLMAAYGFSERDLSQPEAEKAATYRIFKIAGTYTDMQAKLLLCIAQALHCVGFYQRVYNSTRVNQVTVFGLESHLERVSLLYSMLRVVMLDGAGQLRATSLAESIVVTRRSYMTGYAIRIGQRLAEAEHRVTESSSEYALVLIDDAEQARNAQAEFAAAHGLYIHADSSNRSFDPAAYVQGQQAGDASDIGQTRVAPRPALPF